MFVLFVSHIQRINSLLKPPLSGLFFGINSYTAVYYVLRVCVMCVRVCVTTFNQSGLNLHSSITQPQLNQAYHSTTTPSDIHAFRRSIDCFPSEKNIAVVLVYCNRRYFQHAHFIINSGCGKERHILIDPWGPAKASALVPSYIEVFWPCAGGLSAVNVISTQLRDPINSGLTRWRTCMAV